MVVLPPFSSVRTLVTVSVVSKINGIISATTTKKKIQKRKNNKAQHCSGCVCRFESLSLFCCVFLLLCYTHSTVQLSWIFSSQSLTHFSVALSLIACIYMIRFGARSFVRFAFSTLRNWCMLKQLQLLAAIPVVWLCIYPLSNVFCVSFIPFSFFVFENCLASERISSVLYIKCEERRRRRKKRTDSLYSQCDIIDYNILRGLLINC